MITENAIGRVSLRVRRSLTIKQMAMVSVVAIVFIFVFIVIQFFYFVQQNRSDTVTRMESMAHSVQIPLAQALLKADIPLVVEVLNSLQPAGILSEVKVVLPNQIQTLGVTFSQSVRVPPLLNRLFDLPVQVTLPLYTRGQHGNAQPFAYFELQADTRHIYRFMISTLSTLLTTYLLLTLILTVSISWFINRLVIHPIRKMAHDLSHWSEKGNIPHQLQMPSLHQDDEIGLLVRYYNRNQQKFVCAPNGYTELPDKTAFLASINNYKQGVLMIIANTQQTRGCEALNMTQRNLQYLRLCEKINRLLVPALLVRLDNDAVGIFLSEIGDSWGATSYAQQLTSLLEEPTEFLAIENRPTTRIGIAMLSSEGSARDVYHHALSAVLIASYRDGNQVQFFEPQNNDATGSLLDIETDSLNALSDREFAIWLQPQINMLSGSLIGAEVLLRQQQEDALWCLPKGLIERIEDCGLMVTVGGWVLEETCKVLSDWQRCGITLPLSVNLSLLQLMHKDMVPTLLELLDRYQVKAETLTIEITESRRIDDPQVVANILRRLHDAGIHIALDDFGMGYACLRDLHYLKSVPVDILKIDKNFIEDLPEDGAMVDSIITMANILGLSIVAEGVENEKQKAWLISHGVTDAQGFLFSPALPVTQFESQYLSMSPK